jgi:hypothetical protein
LNEDLHFGEWLVTTLEGDLTLGGMISGVYKDLIPAGVDLPAVRFTLFGPHDVRGAAAQTQRIMVRLDYIIAVVFQGHGLAGILPVADRLDDLLNEAQGETSTLRVLTCVRLEPFHMIDPEESAVQYRHAGGLYRTLVQAK